MKYFELVEMWNEEFTPCWDELSEQQKIEFAFDEGRRSGFLKLAEIADNMSEEDRPYPERDGE
jgi:hypothetical protein